MKQLFVSLLVICEIGCGVDLPDPAEDRSTVTMESEDLRIDPHWNACAPPTACLPSRQCGLFPESAGSLPQCGVDQFCCIPPPPPTPPPGYHLALESIHCLFTDDLVGYDEPRFYVNGNLKWAHEHFATDQIADLTHVPHTAFNNLDIYLKVQEWDAWPGATVTLPPEHDGRISQTDGSGTKSILFGGNGLQGLYVVFYSIVFE